ncbi:hypothetical protein AN191_13340 [Loktanella sp. 5RATIMAR09]|uniref:hypothetical protein n=1 Tax=Loktanella sp. 5RATIMAR09 TaxID=1225655 RepID=UPI0006EBDD72|nr:hypothetical protein [Loktanella sp. 5RATIMAR09]KQI71267.1 hypothetical protein AN191_13340 [Loktanella sp. 5RATIMAR09]
MITNFALSLSLDGIELLHRVPRGWRPVGRVDVASKTLEEDLSALREKALLIEPDGLRTKLVIPLDQIKYIALDGTLTNEADIDAALDGATPYALGDLVIDSEKSGGRTHVAAVARDTLREAETFAQAHGFQPVAFVAIPEPFTFQKEVFFGPTEMARSIVGPDAIIDRDDLPVMPVGTRIKSRLLVFDQPGIAEEATYKDDLAILMAAQDTPEPTVAPEPQMTDEAAKAPAATVQKQTGWVDLIPAEYHAPTTPATPEITPRTQVDAPAAVTNPVLLDLVIPEHHRQSRKKAKSPLVAVFGGQKGAAPAVSLGAPAPSVAAPSVAPQANHPAAPDANRPTSAPETNKRPALIAASIAAAALMLGGIIWSQQTTPETTALVPEPLVATEEAVVAQAPIEQPNVEEAAPEAGPEIAAYAIPDLAAPQATGSELATTGPETQAPRGTAPGELAVATADAPLTIVQAPPAPPPAEETAQATVGAPVLRAQVLSPDEAERIYEATGVWQRAPRFFDVPSGVAPLAFDRPANVAVPARPARPDMAQLDEFETDLSFIAPANPPAPEVTFARDADGFILATEEGTVTPEGALVIAGLPDLAITPRPELSEADLERFALLAPAPEGVVIIPGTPAVVPPLRPADAALPEAEEAPEDTTAASVTPEPEAPTPGGVGLGGLELQDTGTISLDTAVVEERALVDLRPQLRPQGLAARVDPGTPDITDILADIAAEDATLRFDSSTALAVVLSIRPDTRPSNFANVVAAAYARVQTQPAAPAPPAPASAAPVVAAAPVAPQNVQPVPGGVARAATQEDAIRLREINLIGVYGRPSARRALVRLSNGRYVRVEIGSELDGGQVTAIGDSALNYVKRGRTYAIELP